MKGQEFGYFFSCLDSRTPWKISEFHDQSNRFPFHEQIHGALILLCLFEISPHLQSIVHLPLPLAFHL